MTTKSRKVDRTDIKRAMAERLAQLKNEHGLTVEKFAERCGAPQHTTAREWLNGRALPRAENIRQIAERFDVTADWLLGMVDAPKFREGAVPENPFEVQLAGHVRRALAVRFSTRHDELRIQHLDVDSGRLLKEVVEDQAARACKTFLRQCAGDAPMIDLEELDSEQEQRLAALPDSLLDEQAQPAMKGRRKEDGPAARKQAAAAVTLSPQRFSDVADRDGFR